MTPPALEECLSCRRPKASLHCELCEEPVCKDCVQRVSEETFSFEFSEALNDDLKKQWYCASCYASTVAPALEDYVQTMEASNGVFVFFTTQKARLPILQKALKPVKIAECRDRDELILRLAFQAVRQGMNSIVETEVTSKKVRNAGYQTSVWTGSALPAQVDAAKLERF